MFWSKRKTSDFRDEIESHLQTETERLREQGVSEDDARAAARRSFGNVMQAQERFYESHRWLWWDHLCQDLRFAFRMLHKYPGFTAVAVLTLALGIGANTAVFSVVNTLILRPLPVEQPSQLVFLENARYGPSQSFPNYKDLRDRNRTLAGLVGYRIAPMELETERGAERIWGYLATGNYFNVLGIKPVLGRFFDQNDDVHPAASPYVVLSYGAWQSRFGGDPSIVGKTIRLNRLPYTVLGVAPPDFHGTELFYWPEVWVPMMMQPRIESSSWLDDHGSSNTFVLGRLKPNVSPAQAEADLNALAVEMIRQFPDQNDGLHFKLTKPGLIGDLIGGPAKAFAFGVLILASLVLLAACTNLASMFMARATDRQRELAVRLAIGAGRRRVVRQVLTETLVLSLAGGGAGYLLASFISSALGRLQAPMDFPMHFNFTADWRVFLFALAGSVVAAGLSGSAPAWRASRTDPNAALRGASTMWRGRFALRDLLVIVQVALCFVLVSASFLSLRGLQQALQMDLGFQPNHVSTAAFELNMAGYSEDRGRAFQRQALEAIQHLPGVQSVAYSNSVPLSIDQSHTDVFRADKTDQRPSDRITVVYYQISPGFFATIGTPLLVGRDFTWQDDAKSPRVAIVNFAFAKRIFHADSPIGKTLPGWGNPVEVVGVVADGKYETLTESQQPVLFWPILQSYNSNTTLEVKSSLPSTRMVSEIRGAIAKLDPEMPLYGTGGLEEILGSAFLPARAAAVALSAFGVLAIMLAATGIHGLVSYAVSRRTREIGIRMAIGARPIQILRIILGKTAALLLFGSLAGFALALGVGQVIASIVYEARPHDPLVMFSVWLAIALLGILASWSPARRATRVDPLIALRYE